MSTAGLAAQSVTYTVNGSSGNTTVSAPTATTVTGLTNAAATPMSPRSRLTRIYLPVVSCGAPAVGGKGTEERWSMEAPSSIFNPRPLPAGSFPGSAG